MAFMVMFFGVELSLNLNEVGFVSAMKNKYAHFSHCAQLALSLPMRAKYIKDVDEFHRTGNKRCVGDRTREIWRQPWIFL